MTTPDKLIYVQTELPLAEATALVYAARTVFASPTAMGAATSGPGVDLGRGMYLLAEAIDKATGREDDDEREPGTECEGQVPS